MMFTTKLDRYFSMVLSLVLVACLPIIAGAAQSRKTISPKAAPAKEEPVTWLLAGREGECAPLSLLEKKGAEFHGIKSPNQLAEKMRAAGYKVEIKEYKAASRPAVEVRVPDRGLYVMFVQTQFCGKSEGAGNANSPKTEEQKRKR
jgi:hypothetical protein